MPTYAYRCDSCKHEFELFQSITAKPIKKCPECRKAKVRRMIGSGAGVIFKGAGFYETDYRSDSYKKAAQAEQPKREETKKTSSSDGTPKTTTETKSSTSKKTDVEKKKRKPA